MIKTLIATNTRYPVNRKIVRSAVEDTFKKYKIENANFEVSVAVVGARKMKKLTSDYLGEGRKHQVLAFALEETDKNEAEKSPGFINPPDEILRLGDAVLCWPEVLMEASEDEMLVDDKVYELVCHAAEHLLDIDQG